MKLLDVFRMINESQFLVERDVINAKELKKWATDSATRLTDPQAVTWYASQLTKYLINRYEAGMKPAQVDDNSPEWMVAKAQAGEPIITVEPQQALRQEAEQVIDWLNAANAADNSSPNLRMTWEDAVEAQAEWHKDMARASRVTELTAEQMEGIVTIMEFEDGFRWVDVQTEVCLQHEGTIMGHCVGKGGYTQGVSEGTTKILSLRDGNNNPHATIEGSSEHPIAINKDMLNSGQADLFLDNALESSFVDLTIAQIKGKENRPVVRKYRDYVQEFLTKFQIEKFNDYGGLDDLENCGLFHLKKGGYANTEEVGEHVAKMEDGSVWHRVDNEYVDLRTYTGSMPAKWYLYDNTGRSIGSMDEKTRDQITSIDFRTVTAQGYLPIADSAKYRDHINTAFNSKYDKGRTQVKPNQNLYSGFYGDLERFGLAVDGKSAVNEPQTIGKHIMKSEAGDVYATAASGLMGDMYWLMSGDKIKARFHLDVTSIDEGDGHTITFDKNRGIPSGSMPNFIKQLEETFNTGLKLNYAQIQDKIISVKDMTWEPNERSTLLFEEDGVKFYSTQSDESLPQWYNAVDKHGQLIFNMSIDQTNFKTRMVNDVKVAGYYAVYLIDHLDADIGSFADYSSFARELLEETNWFEGEMSGTWYVEDDSFPIHMVETHTYTDDDDNISDEDVLDEDTTMGAYWDATQRYEYGFEPDHFAKEYEHVYRGGNTGWDDEHQPDDANDDGRWHTRTDWSVEGIGDADTVTHPISGVSVRIQK